MGKKQILLINDSFGRKWYTRNLSSPPTLAVQAGKEVTFIQKLKCSKNDVNLLKIITRKGTHFLKAKSQKLICMSLKGNLAKVKCCCYSRFLVTIRCLYFIPSKVSHRKWNLQVSNPNDLLHLQGFP